MNTEAKDTTRRITNEKDQTINDLKEDKQLLLQKYENCKQLNIDLFTKLERYKMALKNCQIDSDRKAKAIAVYIKNSCDIKQNLCREKTNLESQVNTLKTLLKERQEKIEKLQSDLLFENNDNQKLWEKSVEEKNKLRLECQGLIDGFKDENKKLVNSNKELKSRIDAIRQMDNAIDGQRIEKLKTTIDKQNHLKEELIKTHEINEKYLKGRIDSLTNKYNFLRKQNDLNKREALSSKYRMIASRSLYANAIKRLSKFGVENNKEVFTAIMQIMEKMHYNSSKRFMDKTARTIIEIKKKSTSIQSAAEKMAQNRTDSKINCGFCESGFCSKGYLAHHMVTEHSFPFNEPKDVESENHNELIKSNE